MSKRRLNKPQHLRNLLTEQINILRKYQDSEELTLKQQVEVCRAIAYLSSVSLTAMKDGDLEERMTLIEEALKEGLS